jgi:hypothetical protein
MSLCPIQQHSIISAEIRKFDKLIICNVSIKFGIVNSVRWVGGGGCPLLTVIGRFSYDLSKSNMNPVLDEAGTIWNFSKVVYCSKVKHCLNIHGLYLKLPLMCRVLN